MHEESGSQQQYNDYKLSEDLRLAYQSLLNNVLISNKLLSQETEEDDILSLLLSIARLIIDFEAGAIFRLEGGSYKQVSAMDINEKFEKIRDTYLSEGIFEWATEQKRILVMPEGDKNTHILVPMITEKANIGMLDIQVPFDASLIKNQDLDLLWVVATNASSRCEQIKLNRWSGLVDILLSTLEKVNSSDQLEVLFDTILKGLDQLLHCTKYLLLIKKNNELAIKARYDDAVNYCLLSTFRNECQCVFVDKALKTKKPIRVPNFNESEECNRCPHFKNRPSSDSYLMVVPLIIKDKNYGAITIVDNSYNSRLFSDDSQHIVELFANQVTIVIYQAQLREELQRQNAKINKEIKMAGNVQQSLLPAIKEEFTLKDGAKIRVHLKQNNISITGFYLPCTTLGGDFYDVIETTNKISFTIADVSGHGLSSSLITALFKMALHKFVTAKNVLLSNQICELLNTDLCKFIKTGDYITAFIGFLDTTTNKLSFSSAGHPYPIYYDSANNKVSLLEANGLPLAMLENQHYPHKTIQLNPGDKILLYTDGITEAVNADLQMYKKERLVASAQKHAGLKAFQFIYIIYEELVKFTSTQNFPDDISMLLIEID